MMAVRAIYKGIKCRSIDKDYVVSWEHEVKNIWYREQRTCFLIIVFVEYFETK